MREHGSVETENEERLWSERQRKDRNEILWRRDNGREFMPFEGDSFVGLDSRS